MAAREPAIGIFDSGVGGLTVMHRMIEALPHEHLVYLGDTARYPYGTKSATVVSQYTLENAKFLLDTGVKLLVVACNTMSAVALDALRAHTDVPVIGVIDPGARAAVAATRNRKVGVIGTEGTIGSGSYTRALRALDPELEIYTRACPLFVALAEEGWVDNPIAEQAAATYLASFRQSRIDTLVLGCTHYPLLAKTIGAYLGPEVQLVDSATETAREVVRLLGERGLATTATDARGATSFFVTDVPDRFIRVGSRFLGSVVDSAVRIER
jgi:glutamate racemase